MPRCKVGLSTGGNLVEVEFKEGQDVGAVLYSARVNPQQGDQLLLNGKAVGGTHPVRDGDLLLVSPPVRGGN